MTTKLVHLSTVSFALRPFGQQMRYMTGRSLEVYAICSPGDFPDELRNEGLIHVHTVPMTRAISPLRDVWALLRIYLAMRSIRPDIVHAHTPKAGLLGTVAAFLARVPVRIYHIRGFRFQTAHGWRRRVLITCERMACRFAHRVFCVSHSVREVAIAEGIVAADKITVPAAGSSNGVDAARRFHPEHHAGARQEVREQYGLPADARVLGFVGRIVRDKGIIELSAAWLELRRRFPDLHLMIVGGFEDEVGELPAGLREQWESDPRVILVGQNWDTPRFYAAMDVFCLPTYREGLAIVLLEASAMRLPIVATRIPGCVDVVQDGVTGSLVAAGDAVQLAASIAAYLEDAALGAHHGAAARQRVLRDFAPTVVWSAVYDEYVKLLRQRDGEAGHEQSLTPGRAA